MDNVDNLWQTYRSDNNVNATVNYVRSGQRVNQHSEHECDFFLHLVQIAKMRVLMGQPIVAIYN